MKVGILTTFSKFYPGYSLTGIVKDQATMLSRYGHEVHLFVNERYSGEDFPAKVTLEKKIPFTHLKDYKSVSEVIPEHTLIKNNTKMMLIKELHDYDIIFTHDFVFQGWNLPYAIAIMEAAKELEKPRWMHWVHSVPTIFSDWWDINLYGKKHKIIYPNQTDKVRVCEQFRGVVDDVRVIPHIKDIRTWMDFTNETKEIIDWAPRLMSSDIVGIYPCSVDRLEAKGLSKVIRIFNFIHQSMKSVCLLVVTQWATGQKQFDIISNYKKEALQLGLIVGRDIVFSADYKITNNRPKYGVGLPKEILRELMMLGNLFIMPTREETFGLVIPEISLSGSPLLVLNKSLSMMNEVAGLNGLFFDFGSFHNTVNRPMEERDRFLGAVATIILGRMQQDESIQARTFMRKRYNYDYIYHNYYSPIMNESRNWG